MQEILEQLAKVQEMAQTTSRQREHLAVQQEAQYQQMIQAIHGVAQALLEIACAIRELKQT